MENTTKANIAATKIQANFRGYRVRKRMKKLRQDVQLQSLDNVKCEEQRERCSQERERKSWIYRKKKALTPVKQSSLEERSAVKIQARVRGFLVRKRQQRAREAATRIQAKFRGFRIRKLLKQNEQ